MMKEGNITIDGNELAVYSCNTVVVGSGAAGLNAADRLYTYGQQDIAVVTEGLKMGTSRNTGSDKQTYYKLTLAGEHPDSVYDMTETLFQGGAMDGDIALVEAALSAQCFYNLVDIGVPFPHNRFGEYVGYKTDHDPRQRATSAGPLTSKHMTEMLLGQIEHKGIEIFDGFQVIAILTDHEKSKAVGLLALNLKQLSNPAKRYVLFNCTNVVYAAGGPAGVYAASVYPESQTGSTGIAFEAGVRGKNLTESQYGLASLKFRWNLSGTYQQVLPRYLSTAGDGSDEREFLDDYFKDPGRMLDAIFLKGYQWPFDPRKVKDYGSSLIDILVYHETVIKGRRVWLDYQQNPESASCDGSLDFSLLGEEAAQYLKNSGAVQPTPIERLAHMNQPAVDLYLDHGIDLSSEYLEIAVCAQHNNGGLAANIWWESDLKHFFPVGEVNGTHGIYRPGGSALNSGQVGSMRAAQYIAKKYRQSPPDSTSFLPIIAGQLREKIALGQRFIQHTGKSNLLQIRRKLGERMTAYGSHIRSLESAVKGAEEARQQIESLPEVTVLGDINELGYAFKNYDLLITQYVYLSAIRDYIEHGGSSRGSYLVYDPEGDLPLKMLPEKLRFSTNSGRLNREIQVAAYDNGSCNFTWRPVRPIPEEDNWFENVWKAYLRDEIY